MPPKEINNSVVGIGMPTYGLIQQYCRQTVADQGWNLKELKRQFDSSLYERLALSRDQEGIRQLAQDGQIVCQPKDVLKEPLVLE